MRVYIWRLAGQGIQKDVSVFIYENNDSENYVVYFVCVTKS
jgi:hypothetical protein